MFSSLRQHARDLEVLLVDGYYDLLSRSASKSGVVTTPVAQGRELIVSLTTIRSRLDRIHLAIEGLLRQTLRPNRIALWVHKDSFPAIDSLPAPLRKQMRRGLEIHFSEETWPHKKLLHSLEKWPDALIVTTDDDIVQPPTWLEELYAAYVKEPGMVHCHRARLAQSDGRGGLQPYVNWSFHTSELCRPSHRVVPTGVGGVLYFPGALHADVFDIEVARRLCPRADDLWFKVMALRRGTRSRATKPQWICPHVVQGSQKEALMHHNLGQNANDVQLKALLDHYGIDPARLFAD